MDVSYECSGCGAEISSTADGPGANECPVCGQPRNTPDALAELASAVRTFRRAHRRLAEALQATAGQRPADVAEHLDVPEATARRWMRQGPPDPLKSTR